MEGFGAFRRRTELDFTGADFFALVGATGSGKSTVIDAICFALYGCVPRYEDRRLVAATMSTGAAESRVELRFTVGEAEYSAVRVVQRTRAGGATTREARLERRLPDESVETVAASASELDAAGRSSSVSRSSTSPGAWCCLRVPSPGSSTTSLPTVRGC
jgi:exonuclease SbcC